LNLELSPKLPRSRLASPSLWTNTDFDMTWPSEVTAEFVTCALRALRGDDVRVERESLTRHSCE